MPPAPDPGEQRFVERLRARDERAFNELVELYGDRVFRLMLRMIGSREEAEDMAQETFVQVFKAIEQFRGDARLGTWVYRIAVNLCKNRNRYHAVRHKAGEAPFEELSEHKALTEGDGVTTGAVARPDHAVQGYQVERIVKRCIVELEAEYREILVLRDIEDLSYEEIQEITGLAEGTVKSRLHRARAALKSKVEALLGEKIR